ERNHRVPLPGREGCRNTRHLSGDSRDHQEPEAAERHLKSGAHRLVVRQGERAAPEGRKREDDGTGNLHKYPAQHGTFESDGARYQTDAENAEQRGYRNGETKALRAQHHDLAEQNPDGDHGGEHGGCSRGNAGLRPEEAAIAAREQQKSKPQGTLKGSSADRSLIPPPAEDAECYAGKEETNCRGKEWWRGRDHIADGQERSAPEDIDRSVRQQTDRLP